MLKRAITGAIFVLILVLAIILGELYFHVLFGLITLISLNEFYQLFPKKKLSPNTGFGLAIGIGLYIVGAWSLSYGYSSNVLMGIVLLSFPVLGFAELYRKHQSPFQNIAITMLGWIYIVIPMVLLHLLIWDYDAEGWTNYMPVLSLFILVWTSDTFAYLIGKNFGKHKMFERISPKKSWEGFFGGMFFAGLMGFVLSFLTDEPALFYIGSGVLVAILGTIGDLVESMLKRSLDIKDSGTILPGHGGILDRIDAILYVIPVMYFYYQVL
ncbi:MAG: phosphatidate cytidylyltransferase [Putridiphycobacter sp.]|nr:phosphatidate cytidylyltransferase [Putridiphycobacter sp.]